ncbi:ubiquitin carboxyl-terminal hydrolase 16 [Citrus sinensis]|uniref:Ubiquitin carboxyl-terminal hydrolase 16 n=1 Tax=Citrus sinensis TaxID=2711 RepID=A0ACB8KPL9_CITSI|nr:ubiquitin carboxyl-terminal hydrolase 16 [Citrus sinensis]
MHVTGDLGFSILVLVVSFVFLAIALIIRRKWRRAVARKEEIKRLLILASEEAARAEFEASYGYSTTVYVPQHPQCAVCFSPTTTRCARCKAVRYCSGKCQIVHWRQGHKDECQPPSISHEINDVGNFTSQKAAEPDQSEAYGDRFKFESKLPAKPIQMSSEESESSDRSSSSEGLFSYELFVKLYNWNKVELQPCGLINCGNSCYANVVLQCLAFTPPLTAYFLQGLHSKECAKKDWCFTCELENLILRAKDGKSPLSPIGILSRLQSIGSQLGNGREEDAHEFLRYAIDTMQSVCIEEAGVNASGPLEDETTLIGLTFGGYLRSKIKCTKCHGKSERQERMMDLTVEIEGDIGNLEEALRRYTGTEILDGENKYKCDRCKSYEKAKKKLTIVEAPNILTIALKRFQSGKFGKLNKSIQFPEILDLAPYMSGTSDKLPIYRLYGVVVHLDIMNAAFSGHYVCYVKSTQNKWFKVDDSTVRQLFPYLIPGHVCD